MFAYGDNYWFTHATRAVKHPLSLHGVQGKIGIYYAYNTLRSMLTSSVSLGFFCNWLAQLDDNFCKLNSKSCYLLVRAKTKSHIKFHSQSQKNIREKQFHSVLCNVVFRQQAQYELYFDSAFLTFRFYLYIHCTMYMIKSRKCDMTRSSSTSNNNVVVDSAFLLLH